MADSGKLTLDSLLVADLKRELGARSQDVSGTKAILKERLRKCLVEEGANPEDFTFVREGDMVPVADTNMVPVTDTDEAKGRNPEVLARTSSVAGSSVSSRSSVSMKLEKTKREAKSAGLKARREALVLKQRMMEQEIELRQQLAREEQAFQQKKELAEMSMQMKREEMEIQMEVAENEAELSCYAQDMSLVRQSDPVPDPVLAPGISHDASTQAQSEFVATAPAPGVGHDSPTWVRSGVVAPDPAPGLHAPTQVQSGMHDALLDLSRQALRGALPPAEVPRFSGVVTEYQSFIRAFEARIVCRTEDPAERLYYLEQYVTGKAKDLVKGCMHLPPARGYDEARKLLDKRYGNPTRVVTAYMERVANWPPLKGSIPALDEFSVFLVGCKNAMEVTPGLSEMESPQIMKMIVEKLQPSMQDRWRRLGYSITENQRRLVRFADLVDFVEREAAIATDPVFGRDEVTRDTSRMRTTGDKTAKRSSFATGIRKSDEASQAQSSVRKCYFCRGPHMLHDCPNLMKKNMKERTDFIRERRLCFGCLGTSHVVSRCQRRSFCKICKGRHVTVLHDDRQSEVNQAGEESHPSTRAGRRGQEDNPQRQEVQASNAHVSAVSDTGGSMNIVPVKIFPVGEEGRAVTTYAFLDNGSSASFIDSSLLAQLGVPSAQRTLTLTTVSGKKVLHTQVTGGLGVSDLDEVHRVPLPPLYTLDDLPVSKEEIPRQKDADEWRHLQGIRLSEVGQDVEVGLLIGYNCPKALEPLEVVKSEDGGPYAVGWIENDLFWKVQGFTV